METGSDKVCLVNVTIMLEIIIHLQQLRRI